MNKMTETARYNLRLSNWYSKRSKRFSPWTTYYIQGEVTKLVKIGKTRDLKTRLKNMQMASPDRLVVLKAHTGDVEKTVHNAFRRFRLHGEWFSPDQELLDFINGVPCKTWDTIA